MTSSRMVRGTKARIFLYICGILAVTAIIACYNSALGQLEEARKSNEICHQQEENLSQQLQVISDYKQKLEKSLKNEKADHQHNKNELETKLNEEKSRNEKSINEANLRVSSLQQQLNLLQTTHDDFKEECSQMKSKQLNEINDLQAKLKEVQEELKKVESSKESLKSQFLQMQIDNEQLQKRLKNSLSDDGNNESRINHLTKVNHELEKELKEVKLKCQSYDSLQPPHIEAVSSPRSVDFNRQVKVSSGEYEVKPEPAAGKNIGGVLPFPNNSVSKSTTASSLSKKVSKASLNGARPLVVPTMTPKTSVSSHSLNKPEIIGAAAAPVGDKAVLPLPYAKKKVPEGVVPLQNNEIPGGNDKSNYHEDLKKINDEEKENGAHEEFDHNINNNRNNLGDELNFGENIDNKPQIKQHIDQLGVGDGGDKENGGNEMLAEENDPEEDDDGDEYGDHFAGQKDPAVRY